MLGAAIERYSMAKSSTLRVIAVSNRLKSEIQSAYSVDPAKIIVVHNGVNVEEFHPTKRNRFRAAARSRLGLRDDQFVILFVGGDYRRKGLLTLLAAASRLSLSTRVLAVGLKPDYRLTDKITTEGLGGLVTFVDTTADIVSYYAAADCFALPTTY